MEENSWIIDPRYKHEYLIEKEYNGDESDKHLEVRDCRYSCLKTELLSVEGFQKLEPNLLVSILQFPAGN